ncbi:MAG: hypothetical protein JW731_07620 [Bacteroidales bacterium]|nr:hypothetical protein [Bacteroidales bacterium]
MKLIALSVFFLLVTPVLLGQQTQYLTYKSNMRIKGVMNGEKQEWENKNISVSLDYKTGEFHLHLYNYDFLNNTQDLDSKNDSIDEKRVFTLSGMFPIQQIINQKQSNQNYNIELQLKNDDLDIEEMLLFDMLITWPEPGSENSYRIFSLNGVLNNDELKLPAFAEFEDEIQLWLMFSGNMNAQ